MQGTKEAAAVVLSDVRSAHTTRDIGCKPYRRHPLEQEFSSAGLRLVGWWDDSETARPGRRRR